MASAGVCHLLLYSTFLQHQSNSWYRPHDKTFDNFLLSLGYTNETMVGPLRREREQQGLTEDDVPEELMRLIAVLRYYWIDACVSKKDSSPQKCFGIDEKGPPPTITELDNLWVW